MCCAACGKGAETCLGTGIQGFGGGFVTEGEDGVSVVSVSDVLEVDSAIL